MAEAKVTISKLIGGDNNKIRIEIEDELSGATFVSVDLSLEAFAQAITGLSIVSGEMKVRNLDLIGKRREMKKEIVPTDNYNPSYEDVLELAKPFEVDGWKANMYKGAKITTTTDKKGNTLLSISFVRWVEIES